MKNSRFPVFDKGWIELQDVMGDDQAIVNAARTSYLGDTKGEVADKKLLFYLMEHRHTTPFEMVEFKFRISAPVLVLWQWFRHRTWSYNSSSARYTEFAEDDFYLPVVWRVPDVKNKQATSGEFLNGTLTGMLERHYAESYKLYELMLQEGIAREQARLALPGFAMYYTVVAKVDAHNLMHFLKLRMADEAQWEIRQYARVIYKEFFAKHLPWTAEAFERFVLAPRGGRTDA